MAHGRRYSTITRKTLRNGGTSLHTKALSTARKHTSKKQSHRFHHGDLAQYSTKQRGSRRSNRHAPLYDCHAPQLLRRQRKHAPRNLFTIGRHEPHHTVRSLRARDHMPFTSISTHPSTAPHLSSQPKLRCPEGGGVPYRIHNPLVSRSSTGSWQEEGGGVQAMSTQREKLWAVDKAAGGEGALSKRWQP